MRVAVFTSGRHDWNVLEPIVLAMRDRPFFVPLIIATGIHFRLGFHPDSLGGLPVAEKLDTLQASDRSVAIAQTAGWTTALLGGCLERLGAHALLVVGDRTETLAAGVSAVCLRIPVIHVHGGEETEGSIDNLCRHALSKLASLHFVAHASFAHRLLRMGEQPHRVVVAGAPALDSLRRSPELPDSELCRILGRTALGRPLALFTYHPTTLGVLGPETEIAVVLEAIRDWLQESPGAVLVATRPNQDEGGARIWDAVTAFAGQRPDQVVLVDALGARYYGMLRRADLMVGNSSSGILEAPSFGLPVVNIGDRQRGRLRGENVIDVPILKRPIIDALREAARLESKAKLQHIPNPYGDGDAARRIVEALERLAPELMRERSRKIFRDSETTG